MSETSATSTRRRRKGTWLDMLRSMGLIAVLLLAMTALVWRPSQPTEIRTVDVAEIATGVESAAGFQLVLPALGSDWKATSARLSLVESDQSKHVWHIGYVSPAGEYFAVEQSNTVLVDKFVKSFVSANATEIQVKLAGENWQGYSSPTGVVLAHELADSTLVIVGQNSAELTAFAAATLQK